MKTLEIKKSWFYTAGRKWGWEGKGFDARGVGLNKDILYSCAKLKDTLMIKVDGKEYMVNASDAIAFIQTYKSFYKMPGGTMIGVVSKSFCTPVAADEPIQSSKKAEVEQAQPTLL